MVLTARLPLHLKVESCDGQGSGRSIVVVDEKDYIETSFEEVVGEGEGGVREGGRALY